LLSAALASSVTSIPGFEVHPDGNRTLTGAIR